MKNLILLFFVTISVIVFRSNGSENVYELQTGDFHLKVTDFGARIISVVLPDKAGKLGDVVLGYDSLIDYRNDSCYFGAILGRVANRIGGAEFTLNGTRYVLDANENTNMLHGGSKGFSQQLWNVEKYTKSGSNPSITFTYHSEDGEEGFPGYVIAIVTYSLSQPYKLSVKMEAKALNKPTPINLAQHSYWNLGNHNNGDILSDQIQIFASHITPVDKNSIPTGQIFPVKNTPYDFLEPKTIGSQITELDNGYDVNYVLDKESTKNKTKMKLAAKVYNEKSGRSMKLHTNAPGVQFYTANSVNDVKGKDGYVYEAHAALCLETQGFPDSVNHPNFPSQIVSPGERYEHDMVYTFSIKNDNKYIYKKISSCQRMKQSA